MREVLGEVSLVIGVEFLHDLLDLFFGGPFDAKIIGGVVHDFFEFLFFNEVVIVHIDGLEGGFGNFFHFLFVLQNLVPHPRF